MNFLESTQKVFLTILAIPAVIWSLPAQTNPVEPVWGTPVNGLQISLSLDTSSKAAIGHSILKLDLQNIGNSDLKVYLGGGCGASDHTDAIALIRTDSYGTSELLTFLDPTGWCFGIWGTFEKTLSPGASVSVAITLDHYKIQKWYEPVWQPGGAYTLQAELKGIDGSTLPPNVLGRQLNSWVGTVKSNQLQIHVPAP